jgi:hypothetical protein
MLDFSVDIDPIKTRETCRKKHGLLTRIAVKNDKGKQSEIENTFPISDKLLKIRTELALNILHVNHLMTKPVMEERYKELYELKISNTRMYIRQWEQDLLKFDAEETSLRKNLLSTLASHKNAGKLGSFLIARALLSIVHKNMLKSRKEQLNLDSQRSIVEGENLIMGGSPRSPRKGPSSPRIMMNRDGSMFRILSGEDNGGSDPGIGYKSPAAPERSHFANFTIKSVLKGDSGEISEGQVTIGEVEGVGRLPLENIPIIIEEGSMSCLNSPLGLVNDKEHSLKMRATLFSHISAFTSLPLTTFFTEDANFSVKWQQKKKEKRKKNRFVLSFVTTEYFIYLACYLNLEGNLILSEGEDSDRALKFFYKAIGVAMRIDEGINPEVYRVQIKSYLGIAKILEQKFKFSESVKTRWKIFELCTLEYSMRMNGEINKGKAKKQKYKFHSLGKYCIFNALTMAQCYYELNLCDKVGECLSIAVWFSGIHFHDRSTVISDIQRHIRHFKDSHYDLVAEKVEFERILFDLFHYETLPILENLRFRYFELGLASCWEETQVYGGHGRGAAQTERDSRRHLTQCTSEKNNDQATDRAGVQKKKDSILDANVIGPMSYLSKPGDSPADILQNARTSLRNSVGIFNNLPRNYEQIIVTANEETGVALDFGLQKGQRHSSLTNRYMVLDIQAARQSTNPDGMTPSDITRRVSLGDDGIFEDFL